MKSLYQEKVAAAASAACEVRAVRPCASIHLP